MDKLLIIAAKFYNDPTGGGGTVVKNLIDIFIEDFEIDLVLYRTPINDYYTHENLKTHFHPVFYKRKNKFVRRIINYQYNLDYLIDEYNMDAYIKIIVIHVSKMFGFEKLDDKHLRKTVLFPMFLSPSYRRSNENVPSKYVSLEQKALNSAGKIITPSISEKSDMINFYNIDENKLEVVRRGVNELFFQQPRCKMHMPLKLLVVSTIKEQKNVIEAIYILKKLQDLGLSVNLTIIGRIESTSLYHDIETYIKLHDLIESVSLIQGVKHNELAEEMKESDILILPSLWETFGRVAYEGLSSGLSVFVRKGIDCFSNLYEKDFVFSYTTVDEAANLILDLSRNIERYRKVSAASINYANNFSSLIESIKLKEVILCRD
jgi:glycosyltransferase involved in cell wall biosynthesis